MALPCYAGTCTGTSPNLVAASASYADVNDCVNNKAVSGDTITVPSQGSIGSPVVWASRLDIPAIALTIKSAAGTCTPSAPGSIVTGCSDSTVIDDQSSGSVLIAALSVSAANFLRISGFTFMIDTAHASGMIDIMGSLATYTQVGFRFDHNHVLSNGASTGRGLFPGQTAGLIDHNFFDEPSGNVSRQILSVDGTGEGGDAGFTPWKSATPFGTNQGIIIENNLFFVSTAGAGNEDLIDCYSGAVITIRYNQWTNATHGCHGFDSGGNRSPMLQEDYGNTYTNNSSVGLGSGQYRGGTGVITGNTYVVGSGGQGWSGVTLTVDRNPNAEPDNTSWGACDGHINWYLGSLIPSDQADRQANDNGGDWAASHTYAAGSFLQPTSNNAGAFNYYTVSGGTSGSSRPNPFNQTITSNTGSPTTSDGSVTWINEGGGARGTTQAKWCSTHKDNQCGVDADCPGVETCSVYLDQGLGTGGYPCRDQPGRGGNGQVLQPVYSWSNTGTGGAISARGGSSAYVTSGVDYVNGTPMPGYTAYTYPDPLQGGGSNFTLTVNATLGGTVTSSPAGISCPSTCSASIASGTVVTLSETPATGSTFSLWTEACSGSGSCSVTLNSNQTVGAIFVTIPAPVLPAAIF